MLPFLRLCAAALAAAAVLAAPAAAQAPVPAPVAPADGATAQAGTPLTFTARGQGALVVRVARSPAVVDACGAIAEDGGRLDGTPSPADPTLVQFTAPAGLAAGEWFWQVGDPANCSAGPVRRITVVGSGATGAGHARHARRSARRRRRRAALPKLARAPIPSRIGTSNHALLVLALGEGSPSVSRSRFVTLVRNSARRWRLDARGPVKRVPRLGDAHDDVGFAAALVSEGALGTTTLLRQNYVRVRRVCAAARLPHDAHAGRHARRRARPRAAARRALGAGARAPDRRRVRPRDRDPARARPLGGQPAPHPGRLPRHADGQGPRPGRVVALAERLALRRLRLRPAPARRARSTSRRSPRRGRCITERVVEQTVVVR